MVPMYAHTRHLSLFQQSHTRIRGLASATFSGLLLVGLLAGCGGSGSGSGGTSSSPPPITATQTVGSAGGTVSLPDGSGITLDAGVLQDGTQVRVSIVSTPSVPLAESEVMASSVMRVEIPASSLSTTSLSDKGIFLKMSSPTLAISSVSSVSGALASPTDALKYLRVTVTRAAQTTTLYAKYGLNAAQEATVWITNSYIGVVGATGEVLGVEFVVARILDPSKIRCFAGPQLDKMYQVLGGASLFTFSDSNFLIDPTGVRVPLVLVHGIQLGITPDLCKDAYKDTWNTFLEDFFAPNNELNKKYLPFTFAYNTSRDIRETGNLLSSELARIFGSKPVVVVAHSMGGLISRWALVNNHSNIQGIVMLGTPNHGTILRHMDEALLVAGLANPGASIALEGAWFLYLDVQGARQLDWDNFDGKIPSCLLVICNSFLKELNDRDGFRDRYVAFAGDAPRAGLPLAAALTNLGIPPINDSIVPEVSALFDGFDRGNYGIGPVKDPWTFPGIGHSSIHDDTGVLTRVKSALLGFYQALPPPPSTSVDVTGNWQGTYSDNFELTPQPTTLNLTQTGTSVTGSWTSQFASNGGGTASGTFAGNFTSGNIMTFVMTPTQTSNGPCPGSFSGTATVNGNSTSATYSGIDCRGLHSNGQVSVTKQAAPSSSTFTLAVSKQGTGTGTVTSSPAGIDCGATCAASFISGTPVTVTPTPASGSAFAGWQFEPFVTGGLPPSIGCFLVPTPVPGLGPCTLPLDRNVTATARFEPGVTLTVTIAGPGSGTVAGCTSTCTFAIPAGGAVSLSAQTTGGATFAGWNGGGCSGVGTCTVTMTAAQSVTATFNFVPPTVTVAKTGAGSGTVTSSPAGINCGSACSASFASGTAVTLTPTPASGSAFAGWQFEPFVTGGLPPSIGCFLVPTPVPGLGPCTLPLDRNVTATARFEPGG